MKTIYYVALAIAVAVWAVPNVAAGASGADIRIEDGFTNSYNYKTYLKNEQIRIDCSNGDVTLTGTASNEDDKRLAQETAEALPGVRSVANRIELTGPRPIDLSDEWIAAKVKASLLFHRNVSGIKTKVGVKDGIVTLKGEAANLAQKELTAEYAKDVAGVKAVNNDMAVTEAAKPKKSEEIKEAIDDASITAQIKLSLLWHDPADALKTKVKTNDGVVTLAGKAPHAADKDLATKLAENIHGVKDVVNNMTIESAKND